MARRTRKPSSASRKPSGTRAAASTEPAEKADATTELDARDEDPTTDADVDDATDDATSEADDFDGFDDEIGSSRRTRAKDPVKRGKRRPESTSGGKTSKATALADPEEDEDDDEIDSPRRRRNRRAATRASVPAAAKDSTATSKARARSSAEAERARNPRRRVAAQAPNPEWLAPTAVTLLIVGLVYLVTFYLSSGQLPLPIQNWNLLVGFGIMIAGGGLLMRWK